MIKHVEHLKVFPEQLIYSDGRREVVDYTLTLDRQALHAMIVRARKNKSQRYQDGALVVRITATHQQTPEPTELGRAPAAVLIHGSEQEN